MFDKIKKLKNNKDFFLTFVKHALNKLICDTITSLNILTDDYMQLFNIV